MRATYMGVLGQSVHFKDYDDAVARIRALTAPAPGDHQEHAERELAQGNTAAAIAHALIALVDEFRREVDE